MPTYSGLLLSLGLAFHPSASCLAAMAPSTSDATKVYLGGVPTSWNTDSVFDCIGHVLQGLVRCSPMAIKSRSGDLSFVLEFKDSKFKNMALKQPKMLPRPWCIRPPHKQTQTHLRTTNLLQFLTR